MEPTARGEPGVKMTLRVYRMARDGTVTEDQGTVRVPEGEASPTVLDPLPPCACPVHRAGREAGR